MNKPAVSTFIHKTFRPAHEKRYKGISHMLKVIMGPDARKSDIVAFEQKQLRRPGGTSPILMHLLL